MTWYQRLTLIPIWIIMLVLAFTVWFVERMRNNAESNQSNHWLLDLLLPVIAWYGFFYIIMATILATLGAINSEEHDLRIWRVEQKLYGSRVSMRVQEKPERLVEA